MALRFCDSFDHYNNSQMLLKWTAAGVGDSGSDIGDAQDIVSGGRFGQGYHHNYGGRYLYKQLDAQPTWIVGFALYMGSTSVGWPLMSINDGASFQIELRATNDFRFYVTCNGTVLGYSPYGALQTGVWSYMELKVTINNTTGVAVLRKNGVELINLSSVDTQATGNASANRIYLGNKGRDSFSGSVTYDDLYICDGTTGAGSNPCNDFLGDVQIEALYPNGNGNSSQWLGSDSNSTDNYLLVDESPPNNDTDYVETSGVGNKDTYTFTDLSTSSGSVYGIQPLTFARKTTAGSRGVKMVSRLSGTEVDGTEYFLGNSYLYYADIHETKPGGGDWTITDVNNSEFGQKVTT